MRQVTYAVTSKLPVEVQAEYGVRKLMASLLPAFCKPLCYSYAAFIRGDKRRSLNVNILAINSATDTSGSSHRSHLTASRRATTIKE